MRARRVDQRFVSGKQVTVVPDRLRTRIDQPLEGRFIALGTDTPPDDTTGATLD